MNNARIASSYVDGYRVGLESTNTDTPVGPTVRRGDEQSRLENESWQRGWRAGVSDRTVARNGERAW